MRTNEGKGESWFLSRSMESECVLVTCKRRSRWKTGPKQRLARPGSVEGDRKRLSPPQLGHGAQQQSRHWSASSQLRLAHLW